MEIMMVKIAFLVFNLDAQEIKGACIPNLGYE